MCVYVCVCVCMCEVYILGKPTNMSSSYFLMGRGVAWGGGEECVCMRRQDI